MSETGSGSFQGIAPIIPVEDVADAAAFFIETLRFAVRNQNDDGTWVLLRRGEAALQFVQKAPDLDLTDNAAQTSAYIWVDGVDAYWNEVADALASHPPECVRAPFDQPYGMREFHVAYGAFLVFFGQPLVG